MGIEMVLNDLSFSIPAPDAESARSRMSELIQTIRAATVLGADRVIRTDESFQYTSLAPDYIVAQWRNDERVDREERRYFSTLLQKSPYISHDDALGRFVEDWRFEFKLGAVPATALGAAYVLDALAISLNADSYWDAEQLSIEMSELTDEGMLTVEDAAVLHACRPVHVETHKTWIVQRLHIDIGDGQDLWKRRASLFPSLDWCESVLQTLKGLRNGDLLLRQVIRRLLELENYCRTWTYGPFEAERLYNATPESEATLQRFRTERTFRCSAGVERVFSWHLRLTPRAWRIYFLPLARTEDQQTIVGYIGPHLPTITDPN